MLLGALLADLVRCSPVVARNVASKHVLWRVLVISSLAMALAVPKWRSPEMPGLGMSLVAVTGGLAILRVQCAQRGPVERLLEFRTLIWIGRRSYFIYLTHYAFLVIAHALVLGRWPRNESLPAALVTVAALLVTLGAAEVSRRCIEAPALAIGRTTPWRRSAGLASVRSAG